MRAQGGVVLLVCGLPLAAGRAAQIGAFAGPLFEPRTVRPLRPTGARGQVVVASSAAGAAGEFNDDAGWKEAEKSFGIGPQPPTYKKGGIRLPSLLDLSSTIPPVSLRAKIFNAIFRRQPVYSELHHLDYRDACRSLGVNEDIDEAALADRVRELLGKYAKDRKRRIMIEWAEDKILEERLFRQLNGETPKFPGYDPKLLDERFMTITESDERDFKQLVDITDEDLKGPPSKFAWVFKNPIVRFLRFKRLTSTVSFVLFAFSESLGTPNLRRLLWPGLAPLVLASYIGKALEAPSLQYTAMIFLHAGPIYNRGEPKSANRRERRPVKWRKLGLAMAFTTITTLASIALGQAWVYLKYPTFDLQPLQFTLIMTNVLNMVMSSSLFIRDSTLGAGEKR